MSEFTHDTTIGSWYFQATPTAAVLDKMCRNTRAAHWNKPRATRYRASADIGGTLTQDTEDTHQLLLSGVRVIRGPTQNLYYTAGAPADVEPDSSGWFGDPQVLFPTGPGLAPFIRRPVPIANAIGFEIEKTNPVESDGIFRLPVDPLEDYEFLNWFGGLNWDAASATSPDGIEYNVNQMFDNDAWIRVAVARPIPTTHTGQAGAIDLTVGMRFRIIFGRLGGAFNHPGTGLIGTRPVPRGYYIHYHVMGPVAAY